MEKLFMAVCLLVGMVSSTVSFAKMTESEAAHLAKQFITVYESNAQLSSEAVHQLAESAKSGFAYVALKKPVWRGSSQTLLVCSTKILNTGMCRPVEGKPSPWLTPQAYIETVWPDRRTVLKKISHYPSTGILFLFYSFLENVSPDVKAGKLLQDPNLSAKDIPWNQIGTKKTAISKAKTPTNKSATKKKKPGIIKLPYKDFYVQGKDYQTYSSDYFTVKLRSFAEYGKAHRYRKRHDIPNSYIITTRKDGKNAYYLYFGAFPTESDVYKAIETLPGVIIRRRPSLHSMAQIQLQDHIYTQWKQEQLDAMWRAVGGEKSENK